MLPNPPPTEVVNAAIALFAAAFPLHAPKIQESILEQISSYLSSASLQREPARRLAMTVNIATALLGTMTVAVQGPHSSSCDIRAATVEKALQELLHASIRQLAVIV